MEFAINCINNRSYYNISEILQKIRFIVSNKQLFFDCVLSRYEEDNIELYNKMKQINDETPLKPQDFAILFRIRLWLLNVIKMQQNLTIISPHKWQFPLDITPNHTFSKKMVFILPKCWPPEIIAQNYKDISIRVQMFKYNELSNREVSKFAKSATYVYTGLKYNKTKHQLYILDSMIKTPTKQNNVECYSITFQAFAPFLCNEISLMQTTKTFAILTPQHISMFQSFQWYSYLSKMLKVEEMNLQNMIQQLIIWCVRHLNRDCKIYQVADFELMTFMNLSKHMPFEDVLFTNITSRFKLLQHCPHQISSLYGLGVLFFANQTEVVSFITQQLLMDQGLIFMDNDKITRVAWLVGKTEQQLLIKVHNIDLLSLEDLLFLRKSFGLTKIFKLNRLNGHFYSYDLTTAQLSKCVNDELE